MVRLVYLVIAGACVAAAACASNNNTFDNGVPDSGKLLPDGAIAPDLDGGNGLKDGGNGNPDGAAGPSVIYAHTDTELYSMDPMTQKVTDIGAFTGQTGAVTDLAVNSAGDVWVNTENAIFKAAVPKSSGPVPLTKVADIKVGLTQKFYALGFAPVGVLGMGETLVAGDNLGELYAVDGQGALTQLGSFGSDGAGGTYELSGDVVFYMQNNKPRGLATVRLFKQGTPDPGNDLLAEIDVPAMVTAFNSKTPAASLKKQFIGTGTKYGKLYGLGAWNDSVFAFSRVGTAKDGGTPARLIGIDKNGVGTPLQSFPNLTAGWSGAGVTTSATITILPPN